MFFKTKSKVLEGIEFLEAGNLDSPNKVVLLHGYGANMQDLYSLSDVIQTKKEFHWIFPNGILNVPIGPHMMGKAWFQIDIEAFERAVRLDEFSKKYPTGMKEAQAKISKFLKALNLDPSKTFLGGFSQGAMLTLEVLLETDFFPKGALLLSSTLVHEERWIEQMPKKKSLKYYQSHGRSDPVLPYSLATRLNDELNKHGWDGFLNSFEGGHEIPMSVIRDIGSFLSQ